MDIINLGIGVNLKDLEAATRALQELSKAAGQVESSTKNLGVEVKKTAKTSEDASKVEALNETRKARARLDDAKAEKERQKALTEAAKTRAEIDATAQRILNQQLARENARTRLAQGAARMDAESLKRQELLAAKEMERVANANRLTELSSSAKARAAAYEINQRSLVENRALATDARITASAQRQALMVEKFEYQKAQAAERAARRREQAAAGGDVLQNLSNATVAGYGLAEVGGVATSAIRTADTMVLLDSRLKLATKSQEEFTAVQQQLRQSSVETGLSLENSIAGYTQLERSTRSIGLSTQQLTFLTESFGKAAVVSGADASSFKSALTQLNQGFASGVVRGQEFNSVAEQAPAIMEALANGLRGTNKEFDGLEKKGLLGVAALRSMANEGKLTNDVTIPALIEGMKGVNKQFDEMPLTVERAFGKLKNQYSIWIADQNQATGATKNLAEGVSYLATNFDSLAGAVIVVAQAAAVFVGVKLAQGIGEAVLNSKALAIAKGDVAKASLLEARSLQVSAAAADKDAAAQLRNAEARLLNLRAMAPTAGVLLETAAATNALTVAQQRQMIAANELAVANKALDQAQRNASIGTRALGSAFALIGGWPTLIAGAVILIISYWDDIRAAMGSVEHQANKTRDAITKAVKANDFRTAKEGVDELERQYAQAAAELSRINAQVVKATTKRINPKTGREIQSAWSEDDVALLRKQQQEAANDLADVRIRLTKAREEVEEGKARQRQEALTPWEQKYGGIVPTPRTTPTPDKKDVTPSAFAPEEKAVNAAVALNKEYDRRLSILKRLNGEDATQNEHLVKLASLQQDLADLDKGSKEAVEHAANIRKEMIEQAKLAKKKDLINYYEDVNKALVKTSETANKFAKIDLTPPASAAEQRVKDVEEAYERALQLANRLKDIEEKGVRAGASPEMISASKRATIQAFGKVAKPPTFEDQISTARATVTELKNTDASAFMNRAVGGDEIMQLEEAARVKEEQVRKAEEALTAIEEAESLKRRNIARKELEDKASLMSSMGGITESMMSVLETAGQKQSGLYAAMFAANKAYAIATSIISIQKAYADAFAVGATPVEKFAAFASIAAGTASIVSTISSTTMKFAKGAAFSNGDVVSTPTTFPMSGGRTGLMGEAGAEAVMPLSRDSQGRLGVNVNGGSNQSAGGVIQSFNIEINVTGSQGSDEETAKTISKELVKTIERIADSRIVQATRPAGILAR